MNETSSKQNLKASARQLATVIDLNKCMGCQSCTVACKNLWTQRPGTEHMRWANVGTYPGRGYPRDWQSKGGGYDEDGNWQEDDGWVENGYWRGSAQADGSGQSETDLLGVTTDGRGPNA